MTLLGAFRPTDTQLTLAELTRRTGIPKPTIHRLVVELAGWQVAERPRSGVRATVHLAAPDGVEVVYVEKIESRRAPPTPSRVGGRLPAHCTGVGKALLAYGPPARITAVVAAGLERRTPRTVVAPGTLPATSPSRPRGYAQEHEESTAGVACIAPVRDAAGNAVAAVSVSGWVHRLDPTRCAPAVCTAALGITRALAGTPAD